MALSNIFRGLWRPAPLTLSQLDLVAPYCNEHGGDIILALSELTQQAQHDQRVHLTALLKRARREMLMACRLKVPFSLRDDDFAAVIRLISTELMAALRNQYSVPLERLLTPFDTHGAWELLQDWAVQDAIRGNGALGAFGDGSAGQTTMRRAWLTRTTPGWPVRQHAGSRVASMSWCGLRFADGYRIEVIAPNGWTDLDPTLRGLARSSRRPHDLDAPASVTIDVWMLAVLKRALALTSVDTLAWLDRAIDEGLNEIFAGAESGTVVEQLAMAAGRATGDTRQHGSLLTTMLGAVDAARLTAIAAPPAGEPPRVSELTGDTLPPIGTLVGIWPTSGSRLQRPFSTGRVVGHREDSISGPRVVVDVGGRTTSKHVDSPLNHVNELRPARFVY